MLSRRGFVGVLGALIAAPAIVRVESLMPVRRPLIWTPVSYNNRQILTLNEITREAIRLFQNSNLFIEKMMPSVWDDLFEVGTQVRIVFPDHQLELPFHETLA